MEAFLQEVTDCEAENTKLWPNGGYNVRDETLNGTGWRVHQLEALREIKDKKWEYVIQPALDAYYEKHGNLWSVPKDEPIIGTVVQNMRRRCDYINSNNPKSTERIKWLRDRKWADNWDIGKWDNVIKPALDAYYEKHGNLWSVPKDEPIIGNVVQNMRSSGAYISSNNPKAAERIKWLRDRKWGGSTDDGRWDNVIKPALDAYYEKHGNLWSVPKDEPIIGTVVNSMRCDGCYIYNNPKASERLEWLRDRKWADSTDDGRWEYVIQPALDAYYEKHGNLWSVPKDEPIIGGVVTRMRSKKSYISSDNPKAAERIKWLQDRKWADRYLDANWDCVIQPALQSYYEKHGNLWTVPQDDPIIGTVVNSMRSSGAYISSDNPKAAERLEWLLCRKWTDSADDGRWEYEIKPALDAYYEEHKELWSSSKCPIIGMIVCNMRSQKSYISSNNPKAAERIKWLRDRKWSDSTDDGRWEYEIKPALDAYYEKHGNLWSVPNDEPIIGTVVTSMQSSGAYILPGKPKTSERLEWLRSRKWADSYKDGKWEYVIQPALQAYYDKHKELWSVPAKYPVIGDVIHHMRTEKHGFIPTTRRRRNVLSGSEIASGQIAVQMASGSTNINPHSKLTTTSMETFGAYQLGTRLLVASGGNGIDREQHISHQNVKNGSVP